LALSTGGDEFEPEIGVADLRHDSAVRASELLASSYVNDPITADFKQISNPE
jgi:hypothetical protein